MNMIEVKNLKKSYGDNVVLKDVSFSVKKGEVVVIIGSSGTGKSTLLRCMNYLDKPDSGIIHIGDVTVDVEKIKKKEIYQLRRKSCMVFQDYNLFLNKNVLQNIMVPLQTVNKISKQEAYEKALEVLEAVDMLDKQDSYPSMLSGGQQQRVSIARAIAQNPDVILFDEPTSALDPELVGEVLELILKLAKQHMTMIIVTHEISFASKVADRIIFMDGGNILINGTPKEVLEENNNPRIQQFLSWHKEK